MNNAIDQLSKATEARREAQASGDQRAIDLAIRAEKLARHELGRWAMAAGRISPEILASFPEGFRLR